MSFIVDEYLENYIQLHKWLIGIGFPKIEHSLQIFVQNANNQLQQLVEY